MSGVIERETRCYAVSGRPEALDGLERILRDIERGSRQEGLRVIAVLTQGGGEKRLMIRVLASWVEEDEEDEAENECEF